MLFGLSTPAVAPAAPGDIIVADPPGPVAGTGPRFRRDRDPRSKTNPLRADTDRGGTPDGKEDRNRNGRVDLGENDPTKPGDVKRRRRLR